ncbi:MULTISPECIES: tetratricopeptide repeat-containing sulfotransferase family protein [unclassified Mesorhizobium]|uniref:tetratricopeptide repeat-containing sulfotransferase family protein n=1 Tax=unclassified Mesorhizobium TaxID=325217 RepID=UPI000BB0BB18|nr:sulfotransferase family protein [Mesorhizobium sp. M3A.F.Ca.ET.080.04.2.1]PBB86244.1 sulfotransferase [Mesorhizobium sp. WSM3876]RWB73142.1 MAG: sulfotransferase family protein [Mesorhizobium sp.]TGS65101.1 sulfotransferase family protein [Mesorhizobium sp. M3A.F.Ca.ET.201.01.1.1]TGS84555.1 sulfotransferase family protein [Mesorhizobium sp. M3A.F.Ca.ET.175.01.1.1]TGT25781.1 sulfotransferase family protein [Mesorhizobium sp. M3A.F.Ca.ET.174.01.1.1]TGT57408.1 sulfotransferase family protein 
MQLHQAGRRQEAESLYRQVLGQKPDHAAALHFLGLLLHQTGRSEEGLDLIEQSVTLQPRNADFLNNMGTVMRDLGRVAAAVDFFRGAVDIRPDQLAARDNLGSSLKQLGQFEAAEEIYRGTIGRNPFHVRARIGLAETLQEAGRLDDAIALFRESLSIRPKDAELLYGLGVAMMEKGKLSEAADLARQAVAIAPAMAKAWLLLTQVKRQTERDGELAGMEAQHSKAPQDSLARMQLSFGLGKANDDLKDYGRAFDYFAEGNAIRRKGIDYDPARTRDEFEAMKAVFDKAFFDKHRPSDISDDAPIFVVGMPRSGTTLVEQIIASHPQVFGAGELSILKTVVGKQFPMSMPGGFPSGIADMPDTAFAEAGQAYLDMLHTRYPGFRHVTDKMPGNFLLVGFLHMMLPKAKIVHCARDAAATCLSIFKVHFRGDSHRYGYDLAELADFHNLYTDIMAHWHKVLSGVVHDVRYEDFVADQEAQTRALMAHLGLPWDDKVLSFHETDRAVRTASAAQVRQPMYQGSVDLWKRYGDRLKPLLDRLS